MKAAAVVLPTLTVTPQLLQLHTLQDVNTTVMAKPNSSSTNLYLSYKWHIPNTNYEINIESSAPPIRLSLPLATLKEVYMLAMQACLVKIAQGLDDSPSVSATFTSKDIRLDWVIPEFSSALHYSILLQVFQTLVNLHVRPTSPLPYLIGEELNFTVVDQYDGSEWGEGRIVDLFKADNEVLAERSVDPSLAPKLLHTLASQRLGTTASLSSNTTGLEAVFDYPVPSTPYTIMIYTYTMWDLIPMETLELVYNNALIDLRIKVAEGRGSVTPPMFGSYHAPIRLAWQADLTWRGLNYSMLSIVIEALKQLHTDPRPSFKGIYRKVIYFDILEQRGAQRIERGEGQVESSGTISKRRSVNPLQADYEYEIDATPYSILITTTPGPAMAMIPLQETYHFVLEDLAFEIERGHAATIPIGLDIEEAPVHLHWRRSHAEVGLSYTDLQEVFTWLSFVHTLSVTPWFRKSIEYRVVRRIAQGRIMMGEGWVGDLQQIASSNVSVQASRRDMGTPVNPSDTYAVHLLNTPYIINMEVPQPEVVPKLPLDSLRNCYNIALFDIESQIQSGNGGDVPATYNREMGSVALDWRREHPPGLNYTMLQRVYRLLRTLQTNKPTSFPGFYRQRLNFSVVTTSNEIMGFGNVRGLPWLD